MVTFEKVTDWNELKVGLGSSVGTSRDEKILAAQIKSGRSDGWRASNGTYLITRGEGTELVLCCIKGTDLKSVANQIVKAARAQGFKTIRFHASRPTYRILYYLKPQHIGFDSDGLPMYQVSI